MVEAEAWGRLHVGKCDFFLGFIGADQDKVAVFKKVLGDKDRSQLGKCDEHDVQVCVRYILIFSTFYVTNTIDGT